MNARGKTIGAALAAAVALASGAYALGSQAGGGSAQAAKDNANQTAVRVAAGPGFAPGFGNLADRLGVDEDKLEDAMRSLRQDMAPPDPTDMRKELAAALGVSESELQAAMKSLRADGPGKRDKPRGGMPCGPGGPDGRPGLFFGPGPGPGPDGGAALAKALGIDESKVDQAFETLREKHQAEMKQRHEELTKKLAAKLGISAEKVEEALPAPSFDERRHP